MPLDPRSLNTIMGAVSGTEAYQSAMQSVRQARDDISDRVDALVDKGKAALGDVLSSVGAVVDKYAPSMIAGLATAQFRGRQGSFMSFVIPIRFSARFFTIAPDRHEEIGYPLHTMRRLASLSGFVLCENAKVPLTTSQSEQAAVEAFLNSGVFLE